MKKKLLSILLLAVMLLTLLPADAFAAESLPAPLLTGVCNTENGVKITWKAVDGAVRYRVLQKRTDGTWCNMGSTTATHFTVIGLSEGTTYTFSVRCVSADGKTVTGPYNKDGVTITYKPVTRKMRIYLSPSDQVNNAYAYGNTTEALQCRRIANALENALVRCGFEVRNNQTGSMVQRVNESNDWHADLHVPLHTNAFNGKVSGTRIFANDTTGKGYRCALNVFAYLAPLTPGKSEGVSAYKELYEIKNSNAPCVYIESEFHDVPSVAQWIINHTGDIGEAICRGICSYFSTEYVENKPVLKSAVNSANGIKLAWESMEGAVQYKIYRSTDGTNYKYYSSTVNTCFTNTSVDSGTKYYYKIKAVSQVNGTDFVSKYSNVTSAVRLSAPTTEVTPSASNIKLSWNAVPGADIYYIYRSMDGRNFTRYDKTSKTAYTNTKVEAGIAYYYKVKAVQNAEDKTYTSAYSKVNAAYVMCAPEVSVAQADGKVKLNWPGVIGADQYYIYRSTDNKKFSYYSKTSKTTYTNSKVEEGATYFYKVKAVYHIGDKVYKSDYSNVNTAYIPYTPAVTVSQVGGKVILKWSAVDGASKYWIYRSTDGVHFSYYGKTSKTTYTNSKVEEGITYYYKVKTACEVGDTTYTSACSEAQTAYVLCAPEVTIAEVDGTAVLSWNAVDGADRYWVYRSSDGVSFKACRTTSNTAYTVTDTACFYKVKSVTTVDGVNWSSGFSNMVSMAQ